MLLCGIASWRNLTVQRGGIAVVGGAESRLAWGRITAREPPETVHPARGKSWQRH
jgi:hypothetical protein